MPRCPICHQGNFTLMELRDHKVHDHYETSGESQGMMLEPVDLSTVYTRAQQAGWVVAMGFSSEDIAYVQGVKEKKTFRVDVSRYADSKVWYIDRIWLNTDVGRDLSHLMLFLEGRA